MSGIVFARSPPTRPVPGLMVAGALQANSAAKFWATLLGEIVVNVPQCRRIVLRTFGDAPLTERCLYPQRTLEEDLRRWSGRELRAELALTLAEIELAGPAPTVHLDLQGPEGEELLSRALPRECLDADLFPYLAGWLLHWAGIPESAWNQDSCQGVLLAECAATGLCHWFELSLANHHLSEGLFRRCLTLGLAGQDAKAAKRRC